MLSVLIRTPKLPLLQNLNGTWCDREIFCFILTHVIYTESEKEIICTKVQKRILQVSGKGDPER